MLPRSVSGRRRRAGSLTTTSTSLHLFTPDTRSFYRLEDLWSDVPAVELEAATG